MIQPVVEGDGDVSAVPVLLRRLEFERGRATSIIGKPIKWKRTQLVRPEGLRNLMQLIVRQPRCRAVLILLDGDDDCPRELGPRLESWARREASHIPTMAVVAHREFEAWFLASIESLRGQRGVRKDARAHPDPESPRDAKGEFERRTGRDYVETVDQPAFAATFDLAAAHAACRSFRRLVSAFERLMAEEGPSPDSMAPRR